MLGRNSAVSPWQETHAEVTPAPVAGWSNGIMGRIGLRGCSVPATCSWIGQDQCVSPRAMLLCVELGWCGGHARKSKSQIIDDIPKVRSRLPEARCPMMGFSPQQDPGLIALACRMHSAFQAPGVRRQCQRIIVCGKKFGLKNARSRAFESGTVRSGGRKGFKCFLGQLQPLPKSVRG